MQVGLEQLLERDTERRLGFIEETSPIRDHPFFRDIDWVALEGRKLEPPFKPKVVSTFFVRLAWPPVIARVLAPDRRNPHTTLAILTMTSPFKSQS